MTRLLKRSSSGQPNFFKKIEQSMAESKPEDKNHQDGKEEIGGNANSNVSYDTEKASQPKTSTKFFFMELEDAEFRQGWHGLKSKLYQWFVQDGYIFDMIAAGLIILINSLVALEALSPIHR